MSLATAVHRAARGFPLEDAPALIPLVRCPSCDRRALYRTPPSQLEMPVVVSCASPDCGWTGTDEDLPDQPTIPSPRSPSAMTSPDPGASR